MENKIYMTNIPVACQVSIPSNSINEKVLLQRSDLAYSIDRYFRNPKKSQAITHKSRVKVRLDMIKEYGGKCCHCGIDDIDVLDIDHIHNNGSEQRKNGLYGYNLYRLLKKTNWPKDDFQLLCKNCNWKKELKRRREQ